MGLSDTREPRLQEVLDDEAVAGDESMAADGLSTQPAELNPDQNYRKSCPLISRQGPLFGP